MSSSQLREWIHAVPFRPFSIELSSGSRIDVRHPELAIVQQTTLRVVDPRSFGSMIERDYDDQSF